MATIAPPDPASLPARHRLTVDDFHRMGEAGILGPDARAELIDGEVFDMSPIGRLHAALVARLAAAFHESLGRSHLVWTQNPLRLGPMSELQPDLALLVPRDDFYLHLEPSPADVRLVVEVADTSLAHDLAVKTPLYLAAGIPEIWVIDATTRRTHRFEAGTSSAVPGPTLILPDELLCFSLFQASLSELLPPSAGVAT